MRKYLFILILFLIPSVGATVVFEDNFTDGDYTNNPIWEVYSSVPMATNPIVTNEELHFQYPNSSTLMQIPTGLINSSESITISWDMKYTNNLSVTDFTYKSQMSVLIGRDDELDYNAYVQILGINNTSNQIRLEFGNFFDSPQIELETDLGDGAEHHYDLILNTTTAVFDLYVDSSLRLSLSDTYGVYNFSYLSLESTTSSNSNDYFDSFRVSNTTTAPTPAPTPTPTATATPVPNLVQTGCGGQVSILQIKDWFYALLFISCMIYTIGFFYTFGDKK